MMDLLTLTRYLAEVVCILEVFLAFSTVPVAEMIRGLHMLIARILVHKDTITGLTVKPVVVRIHVVFTFEF